MSKFSCEFEKILSLIQNIPINRNGEIVEEFEEGDKPGSSILDHKYYMTYFSVEGESLSEVKERIDKAFSIMKEPKISFRDIIKFAVNYMKNYDGFIEVGDWLYGRAMMISGYYPATFLTHIYFLKMPFASV